MAILIVFALWMAALGLIIAVIQIQEWLDPDRVRDVSPSETKAWLNDVRTLEVRFADLNRLIEKSGYTSEEFDVEIARARSALAGAKRALAQVEGIS